MFWSVEGVPQSLRQFFVYFDISNDSIVGIIELSLLARLPETFIHGSFR